MCGQELKFYLQNDVFLDSLFSSRNVERLSSKARDVFYAYVKDKVDLLYINDVRDDYNTIDVGVEAGKFSLPSIS